MLDQNALMVLLAAGGERGEGSNADAAAVLRIMLTTAEPLLLSAGVRLYAAVLIGMNKRPRPRDR